MLKDQNNSPVQNCELVEVKITNTSQTRFNFPDVTNIRGKRVTAIQAFKVAEVIKTPSGAATVNDNAFTYGFMTLHTAGKEKIKELPLVALHTGSNNGLMKNFSTASNDPKIGQSHGIVIDPQKSFVSFSATSALVAGESVLFAIYFLD